MRKIILASHGDLSKGMLNSLTMIIGEEITRNMMSYSLYPGESASEFAIKLKDEISAHKEDEYIVVADVLGGSVHTALMQIMQPNMILFSGMNMNMLLEIVTTNSPLSNEDSFQKVLQAGKMGITCMKEGLSAGTEDDDF